MNNMNEYFNELYDTYRKVRHFGDEYKAYDKEKYIKFALLLDDTYSMLFSIDLETGETAVNEKYTGEDRKRQIAKLQQAAENMIPLHDPDEDKIFLWNGNNMPWDVLKESKFKKISQDGSEFKPHMIPFCHKDKVLRPAVIILGGGYRVHYKEGFPYAEFFYRHGYQAFVLNNRHAFGAEIRCSKIRAMDVQRAVRLLKARAEEFSIDPERIVYLGSSMGNRPLIDMVNSFEIYDRPDRLDPKYIPDMIDRKPAQVNAFVSVYPAVFPYDNKINYRNFPPSFFVLGNKDFSLWRMMPFISDLTVHGVRVEAHLYDGAVHGFGMGDEKYVSNGEKGDRVKSVEKWMELLLLWLERIIGPEMK